MLANRIADDWLYPHCLISLYLSAHILTISWSSTTHRQIDFHPFDELLQEGSTNRLDWRTEALEDAYHAGG